MNIIIIQTKYHQEIWSSRFSIEVFIRRFYFSIDYVCSKFWFWMSQIDCSRLNEMDLFEFCIKSDLFLIERHASWWIFIKYKMILWTKCFWHLWIFERRTESHVIIYTMDFRIWSRKLAVYRKGKKYNSPTPNILFCSI